MSTFSNFAPKKETSWAKKVVKFIFETWNANDVIVYVCLVHAWVKKKLRTCNVNKNNFKCTNFTIRDSNNSDWIQD